jgi:hypothetical protein
LTSTVTGPSRSPRLQRRDVAHVAVLVERAAVPAPGHLLGQRVRGVVLEVDEGHSHALRGQLGDEFGAQPGGAAADEGDLAAEARIRGEPFAHGTSTARPTAPETSAA